MELKERNYQQATTNQEAVYSHLYGIESIGLPSPVWGLLLVYSHLYGIESELFGTLNVSAGRFTRTFMELKEG